MSFNTPDALLQLAVKDAVTSYGRVVVADCGTQIFDTGIEVVEAPVESRKLTIQSGKFGIVCPCALSHFAQKLVDRA